MHHLYILILLVLVSTTSLLYGQREITMVQIAEAHADCALDLGVLTPDGGVVLAGMENTFTNGEYKDIISIRGFANTGTQVWEFTPNLSGDDFEISDIAGYPTGVSVLLTSGNRRDQKIFRLNYLGQVESTTILPDQAEFSSSVVRQKGFDSNDHFDLVIGTPSRIAFDSLVLYLFTSEGDLVNASSLDSLGYGLEDVYIINNQTALLFYEHGFRTIELPTLETITKYSYEEFGVENPRSLNAAKYKNGIFAILESNTSDSLFLGKFDVISGSLTKNGNLNFASSFARHLQVLEPNRLGIFSRSGGASITRSETYDTLGNLISINSTTPIPGNIINSYAEGFPGAPSVAYSILSQSSQYGKLRFTNSVFSNSRNGVCGFYDPNQPPPQPFIDVVKTRTGAYLMSTHTSEDILKYDPDRGLSKIIDLPDPSDVTPQNFITLDEYGSRFGSISILNDIIPQIKYSVINEDGDILIDTILNGYFSKIKPGYKFLNKNSSILLRIGSTSDFTMYSIDQSGTIISIEDLSILPNISPATSRSEIKDWSFGPNGELALISYLIGNSNNENHHELQIYTADRSSITGLMIDDRFGENISNLHFNSQGKLICSFSDRNAVQTIRIYNTPLFDIQDYQDIQNLPNYTLTPVAFEEEDLLKVKLESRGSQLRTGYGTLNIQTGEITDSITFAPPLGHTIGYGETFQNGYAIGLLYGPSYSSNVLAYLQEGPTNTQEPQPSHSTLTVQNPINNEIRFEINEEVQRTALLDLLGRPIAHLEAANLGDLVYVAELDKNIPAGSYILVVNWHSQLVIKAK